MYSPTDAEREKHQRECQELTVREGIRGFVTFGLAAGVAVTALHFMSKPSSLWRNFRPKAWIVAASLAAGFGFRAEMAGLACARNPPWVHEITNGNK
mmetsp:Transcript_18025/g.69764  ORF Transcript_18025/g.69764 Transcript_18025/m.69764 type:complete len:97 (+) Transcript_18025:97-387(+)